MCNKAPHCTERLGELRYPLPLFNNSSNTAKNMKDRQKTKTASKEKTSTKTDTSTKTGTSTETKTISQFCAFGSGC